MTVHTDADVTYHGIIAPSMPCPLLYLSANEDRLHDLLISVVKRAGLPPIQIKGTPDAAELIVEPARGLEWQVRVALDGGITVEWPFTRPLVYGGGMSTPGWIDAALHAGECWLLVGPPRTWDATATLNTVIEHAWQGGGALGIVPVRRAPTVMPPATPTAR